MNIDRRVGGFQDGSMYKKQSIQGVLEIDPWGKWSDVDQGYYLDGTRVATEGCSFVTDILDNCNGKTVRITVEVFGDEPGEDSDDVASR